MLITILITAAVATPVGYLVGAMVAGSKVVDAERRAEHAEAEREHATNRWSEVQAINNALERQVSDAVGHAQTLSDQLARLTDRDERGRFVRREVDNGARPQEGRFKL